MITTRAVIFEKYGKLLSLDEITISDPKSEEVVVKLFASGICGSQLYDLTNPNASSATILGHEGTGVVIQTGKDVKHVQEGDHVLISWMPYGADENTEYLKWGSVKWRDQTIKTLLFTWAEHSIMHSQFVSKMEKDIDPYPSAIVGCAGIAGYGTVINTVDVKPGQSVAVFGIGGLGVMAINAAKNLKANPIIAIDIQEEKLEFSKKFGATHTINSKITNPVEEIQKLTNGGADFVFDMVGSSEIREQTIIAAKDGIAGYREGGTTVLVGFPKGASEFNPRSILMGQRTYKGSRGGACIPERDFPVFFENYRNGTFLISEAVTNYVTIEKINEAIQELAEGKVLGRTVIKIS
jgi:Zn-dependent alcohol dehydrogenase